MTDATGDLLRARSWDEFVGQAKLKERLRTHIEAARLDDRMMDHMLLIARPGYGKTTLAALVAQELGDEFRALTMPVKEVELIRLFREWDGGVLLLDEIHRLSVKQQEFLLNALEDGWVQVPGSVAKCFTTHLTFILATTEGDKVIQTVHDRVLLQPHFETYTDDDMTLIVRGMATKAGVEVGDNLARLLGRAACGTPRLAGRLIVAARDLQSTDQTVNLDNILNLSGVDPDGLSEQAVAYLRCLKKLGGCSGVKNIASLLRLPEAVVLNIERTLLDKEMVTLEPRGRTLTAEGWRKVDQRSQAITVAERRSRQREEATA